MKTSYFIYIFALLFSGNILAQKNKISLNQLQGVITNNYGESIANATVTIYGNNKLYQTYSDSNGNYCFEMIDNGWYEMIINATYYQTNFVEIILSSRISTFYSKDITIEKNRVNNIHYGVISFGGCTYGTESIGLRLKPVSNAPNQNINSIAAYVRGVDSRNCEIPSINGATLENTAYYIDGVRIANPVTNYLYFGK